MQAEIEKSIPEVDPWDPGLKKNLNASMSSVCVSMIISFFGPVTHNLSINFEQMFLDMQSSLYPYFSYNLPAALKEKNRTLITFVCLQRNIKLNHWW